MSGLLAQLLPWILVGVGALTGLTTAYLRGRAAERNANKAKEADAYAKHLRDLENAAHAGAGVKPASADELHDDPHNRDNR